ncbi:diguanylate cyclase, partial [Arthrobacter deserti]|nr:diguanylate cyclase [Arthrobacter deserti]
RREGEAIAVVYLDLDGFKAINDRYGHDAGDLFLAATAQRLQAAVRPGGVAARIGGDEFVVVLRNLSSEAGAQAAAGRIAEAVALPLGVRGHQLQVRASVGVAFSAGPAADIEELLRGADSRMYAAKRQRQLRADGRHGTGPGLSAAVERGIRRNLLRVALQPIVALDLDAIVGFEALVRYQDEQLGS